MFPCRDAAAVQRLGELLAASSHAPLRALLQPALLPAAAAALRCAALAHGDAAGDGARLERDAGPGSGHAAEAASARGRAWALLGLARLHLARPPAGADPAAKRALKAAHAEARAAEELLPELQARPAPSARAGT